MRIIQLLDSGGAIIVIPRSSGTKRPTNERATARFADWELGLKVEIEKLRLWFFVAEQKKHGQPE